MLLPPPVTHTQIQHQPCHQDGAHTVGMNRNPEGLCVSMELQTTPDAMQCRSCKQAENLWRVTVWVFRCSAACTKGDAALMKQDAHA